LFGQGFVSSISKRITSFSTNANIETSYLRAIGEIRSSGILSGAYVDEIAKGFNDYASKRGFASFFIPQPDGYAPLGLQNLTLTDQNIEFFAFALNQVDTSFGTNNDPLDRALNPDGDDYYDSNVRIGIINLVNDAIAASPGSPMGGGGPSPLNYKFPVAGAFNSFFKRLRGPLSGNSVTASSIKLLILAPAEEILSISFSVRAYGLGSPASVTFCIALPSFNKSGIVSE